MLVYSGANPDLLEVSWSLQKAVPACAKTGNGERGLFRRIVRSVEQVLTDTNLPLQDIEFASTARAHGVVMGAACR
jgi:hypothetical protein